MRYSGALGPRAPVVGLSAAVSAPRPCGGAGTYPDPWAPQPAPAAPRRRASPLRLVPLPPLLCRKGWPCWLGTTSATRSHPLTGEQCSPPPVLTASDPHPQILGSSGGAAEWERRGLLVGTLAYSTDRNGSGVGFGLGWVLTQMESSGLRGCRVSEA